MHNVIWLHTEPLVQTYEAAGTRQGDFVTLELPDAYDKAVRDFTEDNDCGAPPIDSSVFANWVVTPPSMAGHMVDGRYEREEFAPGQPFLTTGGATFILVIEERDAGD